jgi:glycosyltransferase involved in cell wall biosynthesis
VGCEVTEHPKSPLGLRALLSRGCGADVVVLQKKAPSFADGLAWRTSSVPIVFDYDDAIVFRQQPRGGSYHSPTRKRRVDRACRLADAFVCGNEYLAGLCRPCGKPVLVAPSPVPLAVPRSVSGRFAEPVRIGWIGSPRNLDALEMLASPLRELARRRRIVLVIISEASFELEGVPTEHVPWKLALQEQALANLDIGVMPLEDSPWSRGKCAYKLLQYMAAELPVVASPVGMNSEVIRDGLNGLLAATPDEWASSMDRLLADPELARKLGRAGRETVEAGFGYPAQAARWRDFLAGLSGAAVGG